MYVEKNLKVNHIHKLFNSIFPESSFKVARNSFQHFPWHKLWLVIITTLHRLMPKSWYQKTAQSLVNMLLSNLLSGFWATLNFPKFMVALNPHHRISLNLQKVATYHAYHNSIIKNRGLSCKCFKLRLRCFNRLYCCDGNLLCKIDYNLFTNEWEFVSYHYCSITS